MLNVFTLSQGRLVQAEIEQLDALASLQPVWVDLESPSDEEKSWVQRCFGLSIPAGVIDDDLEESARFYEEDNGELHIRSDFLVDADDPAKGAKGAEPQPARNVRVAFILSKNVLFSRSIRNGAWACIRA